MWFNPIMAGILKSPLHGLLSGSTMLVTVRGRKTGREITTPVNYMRRGDELLTVSLRSRTWWRNLRGGSAVTLRLSGQRRAAFATVTEAEAEVGRGLAEIIAQKASYARALGIALDPAGKPRSADLARAASQRVLITTDFKPRPA